VRVRLAVVIVDVRRADAFLHGVEGRFRLRPSAHGRYRMRSSGHVGERFKLPQRSALDRSLGIFSSKISTPTGGRRRAVLPAREGGVELVHIEFLAAHAHVLNQIAERNTSAISSARLISSTIGRRLDFTGSVMVITACGPERPRYRP